MTLTPLNRPLHTHVTITSAHLRRRAWYITLCGLLLSGSYACEGLLSDSIPLALTPEGSGPRVVYDFLDKPLPNIPLPNDDATRYDERSPTKRRVNVSFRASTKLEQRAREAFNQLDGFGTFAPITVSFEEDLDVQDLHDRHNLHDPDNGRYRDDMRDDAVYLLNVDPSCKRFGEEVALDIGRGRFPVTTFKHLKSSPDELAPDGLTYNFDDLFHFSAFDPHAIANNVLFEEWNEDVNKNGRLDPSEDLDGDGELDVANMINPEACDEYEQGTVERSRCVADELMTFYDRAEKTLILRPVWPLEQRCTYAVVLTKRLKGERGQPVRSPFKGVHPQGHTNALKPVEGLLARYQLELSDVAFMWSFTTGTTTRDLEAVRAGLYGHGPFAQLRDEFKPEGLHLWTRGELDVNDELPEEVKQDRFLPGPCVGIGITQYWKLRNEWDANLCAIEADVSGMAQVFGGTFKAPDLLVNRDEETPSTPRYPQTSDERWEVEAHTGKIEYGETEVTFWCSLPEERSEGCTPGNPDGQPFCKPFPTILYAHGYGGSRAEVTVGHIGRTNSMGYAMCALDAYGHGLNVFLEDNEYARETSLAFRVLSRFGIPDYKQLLMRGRDRDLDNDGIPDSGADMWTSDIFHTRDMVRQTSLEYMQFVRTLRAFDGERTDETGALLGDIDGDGEVDLGGPKGVIGMWGISLGGIIAGVLAGSEPALDAVSPNAGGAGLVDIAVRSSQQGVPQAVMLPVLGPFVVGCLPQDDHQAALREGEGKSCFRSKGYTPREGEGDPLPDGERARLQFNEMELGFLLNNNARQRELTFAKLSDVEPGDWIELENLENGEVKRRRVDARGRVMVSVPADALTAPERRPILGLTEQDREPVLFAETPLLGDKLIIRHYKSADAERLTARDQTRNTFNTAERLGGTPHAVIDQFMWPLPFQGTIYAQNAPLVAPQEGLGIDRNTPRLRRFLGLAQMGIAPGDPAIWSEHIAINPLEIPYDEFKGGHTRALQMPTVGDSQVPTSTGISAARVAGVLGDWRRDEVKYPDPHYGWRELFQPLERATPNPNLLSADQLLIERFVVEGDPHLHRWRSPTQSSSVEYQADEDAGELIHPFALFDIENISDGEASFSCGDEDWSAMNGEYECSDEWRERAQRFPVPYDVEGLRLNVDRGDGRHDALRVPLLRPVGQHGIYNPQPFRIFDADAFMVNFTTRFLGTSGRIVSHESGCDCSASMIPEYELNGAPFYPMRATRICEENELRLCNQSCAEAWGIQTNEKTSCNTF